MKREKWPYIQISKNDIEQNEIKKDIEDCCVAFIDILGFKEMVNADIDKVIIALRYIEVFCDSFYKFPTRATDQIVNTAAYSSEYDKDYLTKYEDVEDVEDVEDDIESEMHKPTATMFSDSIVISQPMDDFFGVSEFIEFISKMQYQLLLEGVLIRGGISYGKLYHRNGYIFGDGLISAYKLESTIAKFPRIIISSNIIQQLDAAVMKKFESSYKHYIWHEREKIYLQPGLGYDYDYDYSPFIKIDSDGIYYIDYLHDNLDLLRASTSEFMDVSFQLLNDFFNGQYSMIVKHMTEGLKNSDSNVYGKYLWLKNHFNKTIKSCLNTYIGKFENEKSEKDFFDEWEKLYIE